MSIYHLRDTVDRSIIIEEAWFRAHTMGLGKVFDWVNPYPVPSVYAFKEGKIERWDQLEAYAWIRDQLFQEVSLRPTMVQEVASRYGSRLRMLDEVVEKGCPRDIKGLLEYLELFLELMIDFVVLYHVSEDVRTPEPIRVAAAQARDTQDLFRVQDACIRAGLFCLYPELKGFEQGICYREIKYQSAPALVDLQARWKGWVVVPGEMYELGTVETFVRAHAMFEFAKPSI